MSFDGWTPSFSAQMRQDQADRERLERIAALRDQFGETPIDPPPPGFPHAGGWCVCRGCPQPACAGCPVLEEQRRRHRSRFLGTVNTPTDSRRPWWRRVLRRHR